MWTRFALPVLLALEQGIEAGEGLVGVGRARLIRPGFFSIPLAVDITGMFDVMAVDAQELPVASVGRVVVVVVVLVVNRELAQLPARELTAAPSADPGKDL